MPHLLNRHFLKELDFTREEWTHLLDLSAELKAAKRERREQRRLVGRNLALIFEKTSTRPGSRSLPRMRGSRSGTG